MRSLPRSVSLPLLLLILPLLPPRPAFSTTTDTLELMIADSDLVVLGTVTSITDDGNDPAGHPWRKALIQISETIKGPPHSNISIRFRAEPLPDLDEVLASHEPALIFLVNNSPIAAPNHPGASPYSFRDHPQHLLRLQTPTIYHTPNRIPALTMDFRSLITTSEILAEARLAARFPITAPVRSICIQIPVDPPRVNSNVMGYGKLRMPVDERLERLAHQWIKRWESRPQAIDALSQFPSPQNFALLQVLLNDPSFDHYSAGRTLQLCYYNRIHAWAILRAWNQPVHRPLVFDPFEQYHPAATFLIVFTIIALLFVFLYPFLIETRRFQKAPRISTVLLALVTVTFLLLLIRSHWRVDELLLDRAHSQLYLSTHRGHLQLTLLTQWPGNGPPFLATVDELYWPMHYPDLAVTPTESNTLPRPTPRGLLYASLSPSLLQPLWTTPPDTIDTNRSCRFFSLLTGQDTSMNFYRAQLPLLPPALFFTLLLSIHLLTPWIKRRHRLRHGLCPTCAYDLRASQHRCPECGTPIQSRVNDQNHQEKSPSTGCTV